MGWIRDHRVVFGAGLVTLVLVAAVGILVLTRARPQSMAGPGPTVAASPSPQPSPLYALDVKDLSNISVLGPTRGLDSARVASGGDYLELSFSRQSGNVLLYSPPPLLEYRENLEFSVDGGATFYVILNQPESTAVYVLRLDAGSGTAAFLRTEADGSQRTLGPAVPVAGLASGQRLAMTIVVTPPTYEMSVLGQTLIQATENPANRTPGKLGLAGAGNRGTVRIYRAEVLARNG